MSELPAELHEPLCDWACNVMLECTREDDLRMAIGGAVLDLRDLDRILDWARQFVPADQSPPPPTENQP